MESQAGNWYHGGPSRGDGVACGREPRSWCCVAMRAVDTWDARSKCVSRAVALAWQGQDQGPDLQAWWLWRVGSRPRGETTGGSGAGLAAEGLSTTCLVC